MTDLIVLTEVAYRGEARTLQHIGDIYINPAHIVRMKRSGMRDDVWTTIHLAGGESVMVTEKPEEIRNAITHSNKYLAEFTYEKVVGTYSY